MAPDHAVLLNDSARTAGIVENLRLESRKVAQGALMGIHRSKRRGASIEFNEHKLYTPGDDIRHMDWRAFAKSDRLHVKQYEDETNLRVEILFDHSGSMNFRGHTLIDPGAPEGASKLEFARLIAATLATLALRQGDSTGLIAFGEHPTFDLPPRATGAHLNEILSALILAEPKGQTNVGSALMHVARTQKRRTLSFLITDLLDSNAGLVSAFRKLVARRHELIVVQVLDPAELAFPFEVPSHFASMEDNRREFVYPRQLRNAYLREIKQFIQSTKETLTQIGAHHVLAVSSEPPVDVMRRILRRT